MGYTNPRTNEWADTEDLTVLPSTTLTATTNGAAIDVGDRIGARLTLTVTAASGTTPTLDVKLQTRKDANDTWRDLAGTGMPAFAQKTTTGSERKTFVGFDRQIRYVATIGGTTPSFTFRINDGELV
jgi:hypothetical protein